MALEEHDVVLLIDDQAGCSAAAVANWTLLHLTRPNVTVQWHYEVVSTQPSEQQRKVRSRRVSLQTFSPSSFNSYCSALSSLNPTPSPPANATVLIASLRQLLLEHLPHMSWSPVLAQAARHQVYIVMALPGNDDIDDNDDSTTLPRSLLDNAMIKLLGAHHLCLHVVNTNPQGQDTSLARWLTAQLQAVHGSLFHLDVLDIGADLHHDGSSLQLPTSTSDTATAVSVRRSRSARRALRHDPQMIAQRWHTAYSSPPCRAGLVAGEQECCGVVSLVPLRDSRLGHSRIDGLVSRTGLRLAMLGLIGSDALAPNLDYGSGLLLRACCAIHPDREALAWLQLLFTCQQAQQAIVCHLDGPCVLLPSSINTAVCYRTPTALVATAPLPDVVSSCGCQGKLPSRGLHTYLPNLTTVAMDDAFECADDEVRQAVADLHQQGRALETIRWLSPSLLAQPLPTSSSLNLSRQHWQQQADLLQRDTPAGTDIDAPPLATLSVAQAYAQCESVLTALRSGPRPDLDQLTEVIATTMAALSSGTDQCKLLLRLACHLQAPLDALNVELARPFLAAKQGTLVPKVKSKRSKRKLPSVTRIMSSGQDAPAPMPTPDNHALGVMVRDAQLQVYTRCELLLHLATNPELKRLRLPAPMSFNSDAMSDDSEASVVDSAFVKDQLSRGLVHLFQNLQPVESLVVTGVSRFTQMLKQRFKREIPGTWRSLCQALELQDSGSDDEGAFRAEHEAANGATEPLKPDLSVPRSFAKPKPVDGARVRRADETNHRKQFTLAKTKANRQKDQPRKQRVAHKLVRFLSRKPGYGLVRFLDEQVMDTPVKEGASATTHYKRRGHQLSKAADDEEIPETPGYAPPVRRSARLTPSQLPLTTLSRDLDHVPLAGDTSGDDVVVATPRRKRAKRDLTALYQD